MLIIALIFFVACLVLVGVGVVLALVGVACVAMLTATGIVAFSTLAAVLSRRVSSGVRAFHCQVCAVMAVPAGVTLFWAASALFGLPTQPWVILATGVLAGIVAGLAVAGVFDWAARMACRRLSSVHRGASPLFMDGSPGPGRRRA